MQWLNEPKIWREQGDTLTVIADGKTDFWRKTHYSFVRDNGHFYYRDVEGDFTCEVSIEGDYHDLYDQAGLMLRLSDTTWLKCGIEFVNGVQQASAVVTREHSDWSVIPLLMNPKAVQLRLARRGGTVEFSYSLDSTNYTMLRLAYLTEVERLQLGVMCAAPEGDGFPVVFEGFTCDAGSRG